MVNTLELKEIIAHSGKSVSHLARAIGISRSAFYNKMNNDSEFLSSEVNKLCEELEITSLKVKERIFFRHFVD